MRKEAVLAAVLCTLGGAVRGEIRMLFDPDPSLAAQERVQAAFLDVLRATHEPPWMIDCITFDDVPAGKADRIAWLYLDTTFQWSLPTPPTILSAAGGSAAYSPPQLLGWPRGFEDTRWLTFACDRSVYAIGFWVLGDAQGTPVATGRVEDERGGRCEFSIPGCDDPAAPSRYFLGFVSDKFITLVSFNGANVQDSYAGLDHVWLAGTLPNADVEAIRVSWFRCDTGGSNDFTLQRDGSPACQPAVCPGPGGGCFGPPVIARTWSADGIAWYTGKYDTMRMTFAADTFVLADTWVPLSDAGAVKVDASGSNLAFWIDDVPAMPVDGVLTLPAQSALTHIEWTCFNRQAPADVWIDLRGETRFALPGEEFRPSVVVVNAPVQGGGTTDPPPGRYEVPRHTRFPIKATAAPCRAFREWSTGGTGGYTFERPETEPDNAILIYGTVAVTPVFVPALEYVRCTWDATLTGIDFAWRTLTPVDAIEVVRDGQVVALLGGDAVAWRDSEPIGDRSVTYGFQPVCGGAAAGIAFSCWVPARPEAVLCSLNVDREARVTLGPGGTLEAHVLLHVHCSHTMQGYSFGLQYDEPAWKLERVQLLEDFAGFYWNYDREPESAACADPEAPGLTVARVYDWVGPKIRESDIELVFAISADSARCCPMRFVDCLGDPPMPVVFVYNGENRLAAAYDGEACAGLPEACGAVGDANADKTTDIADAICVLGHLFGAPDNPGKLYVFLCPDSADVNRDGRLDIADPIALLGRLFPQ